MNIPAGNVLLKPTLLAPEDLKQKLSNLQQHGFNGYVKVERKGGASYYVFLLEGLVRSVVEFSGKSSAILSEIMLYHRIKSPCTIASYVMAPELIAVLAGSFAFQEKYLAYQVRKKEFRKVLGALDTDKTTGIVEIAGAAGEDPSYLILNQGRIVTDNFLDIYGRVVTGPEKVTELIEYLSDQGGVVNAFGESSDEIERRRKEAERDLGMYKELSVVIESAGLRIGGGNVVKVDDALLREWSSAGSVQKVEILVGEERSEQYKVSGKRGLGDKIAMVAAIQKKLGIGKDEPVLVRPAF